MYKLDLEKPEIKLSISVGSQKKQENSRRASTSDSLSMLNPLTVWISTNCGKFLEMRITDHLNCLLRNLYAGQEATVRTGHGTMDWFQIGKAGIKFARRNVNNLRQADDTILMAESKEELKCVLVTKPCPTLL